MARSYGKELIIDLYDCDVTKFTRMQLECFLIELCKLIGMKREDLHFWDYEDCSMEEYEAAPDHLAGTSAVQFLTTSNVTIHTLDRLKECYINIFSCKEFDAKAAATFICRWFGVSGCDKTIIRRGEHTKAKL